MEQSGVVNENPVQQAARRHAALWLERSSWIDHYREITDYLLPRAGRYFVEDTNKGQKRHNSIHDNTGTKANQTLASGLMSGMTSPARAWFRLTLRDKKLAEKATVKTWLHECATMLRAIFASSNTYRALHMMYEELGPFGTAASIVLPDFENVIHHYPLTVGSYALGTDYKGNVDTLVRQFKLTVKQMVDEYGYDKCSPAVQSAYMNKTFDQKFEVRHIIAPRTERNYGMKDAKNMKFMSCFYEPSMIGEGKWLRESGFKRFRVLAPRWNVTAEDTYGTSPGMECLGDIKQLQHQQLRKAQAIDYQSNPPLQGPSIYKEHAQQRLPGGYMGVDSTGPNGAIRTAFDVQLNLQHLAADMAEVRERIRGAFYADLFLMMANDTRSGVTATEVAERHEEKMLMLGPVLERLHNELLSPLIDIAFEDAVDAGIMPPPPPELQGMDINVEFISTLAQAQRMVAAGGVDRLLTTVSNLASVWPDVRFKVDPMQAIDDYGEMFGTNPALIVEDDVVAQRVAQAAQAAAAAKMAEAAPGLAQTAKTASEVDSSNLRDVMNQFTGYGSPSGQEIPA
jgi:hypothetical protein